MFACNLLERKTPFLPSSKNFISAPAINNDRTAGPRYRRLCIAVIFHGVTSDVETYLKPAIKSVFFINRCHRCMPESGAVRGGAGRRGDATNRYQRSRIIIIDAGRGDGRGKTHADFYYIFFLFIVS